MDIEALCFRINGSAPVPGAVVALTQNSTGRSIRRTADFNGRCIFRGLPAGVYSARQVSAPPHLIRSRAEHRVVLTNQIRAVLIGFADSPIPVTVSGAANSQAGKANARIAELKAANRNCRPVPYVTNIE